MIKRQNKPAQHTPQFRETPDNLLLPLAMYRRDVLLEAIAKSAQELLHTNDVISSIPRVLEHIGCATNVQRVHLLVVASGETPGNHKIVDHQVWSAHGISTPAEFQDGRGTTFEQIGFKSWSPRLSQGEAIAGNSRDFEEPVRKFLELGGVRSTVAVPVFVDKHWWGLIAFDECHGEREWLLTEVDTIKILAELVGAAFARAQRQQKLVDANHIIENSPTVLYRLSPQEPFSLVFLSQNIRRYGYEADELLALPYNWPLLIEADDLVGAMANIKSLAAGTSTHNRLDFRFKKPDGSRIWFAGEATALRDDSGRLIAIEGILTDVTERKQAAELLATLAHIDSLTGLPNRAAFLERTQLAFARARRGASSFAIHYLDLDHFKDVNDTLGHPTGDALLQAVAARLKDSVREIDLVSRFGGDEFAVLQEEIADVDDIETLAAKIGRALSGAFIIDGKKIHTTVSIGIVPYHAEIEGPEAMLMKADLALYRAKGGGRNQYRFHVAELDQQAQERMTVGRDLHGGIERGEFVLFYQPQVDLKSGRIVGLEALIRWNHPTRGLLIPSQFIPVAESNGTILAIGQWAIEEACRQMALWRSQNIAPSTVAVNISATQFQFEGALDQIVVDALRKYGVSPAELELELTETVLMETTQRHLDSLHRLRQIGVRLAIDDFGTGFSSLEYLSSFRVARLKLATEFVDDVNTNPDDAAIVRATISLAHELGIEVVAEGVNRAEQREFLISAGCRVAQGYELGKPFPADQTSELLKREGHLHPVLGPLKKLQESGNVGPVNA